MGAGDPGNPSLSAIPGGAGSLRSPFAPSGPRGLMINFLINK